MHGTVDAFARDELRGAKLASWLCGLHARTHQNAFRTAAKDLLEVGVEFKTFPDLKLSSFQMAQSMMPLFLYGGKEVGWRPSAAVETQLDPPSAHDAVAGASCAGRADESALTAPVIMLTVAVDRAALDGEGELQKQARQRYGTGSKEAFPLAKRRQAPTVPALAMLCVAVVHTRLRRQVPVSAGELDELRALARGERGLGRGAAYVLLQGFLGTMLDEESRRKLAQTSVQCPWGPGTAAAGPAGLAAAASEGWLRRALDEADQPELAAHRLLWAAEPRFTYAPFVAGCALKAPAKHVEKPWAIPRAPTTAAERIAREEDERVAYAALLLMEVTEGMKAQGKKRAD